MCIDKRKTRTRARLWNKVVFNIAREDPNLGISDTEDSDSGFPQTDVQVAERELATAALDLFGEQRAGLLT